MIFVAGILIGAAVAGTALSEGNADVLGPVEVNNKSVSTGDFNMESKPVNTTGLNSSGIDCGRSGISCRQKICRPVWNNSLVTGGNHSHSQNTSTGRPNPNSTR